jgi:hypothetical protein
MNEILELKDLLGDRLEGTGASGRTVLELLEAVEKQLQEKQDERGNQGSITTIKRKN